MATRPRTERKGAATRKGRRVTLDRHKAAELFVGGLSGCMLLADKLKLKASVGGALMSALSMAMPDLSVKGLIAAYHKIGGEMPAQAGAELLAATARKPRKPHRRR